MGTKKGWTSNIIIAILVPKDISDIKMQYMG